MKNNNKKTPYLTSKEIAAQWMIWHETGIITQTLASQIREIATRMLGAARYRGYPADMRQDMASEAFLKVIKNLKNVKKEKLDNIWSYITLCCQSAYATYLSKYYRHTNMMRKIHETAVTMRCTQPRP